MSDEGQNTATVVCLLRVRLIMIPLLAELKFWSSRSAEQLSGLALMLILQAMPAVFLKLPDGVASVDDMDLAPLKVQPLLAALTARRAVDLSHAEFRWDAKRPPPAFSRGEDCKLSSLRARAMPPYGGLNKRQLELASVEELLFILRMHCQESHPPRWSSALRCITTQLGIGSKQLRRIRACLARAAPAPLEEGDAQKASDHPVDALEQRLQLLRTNLCAVA